VTGAVDPSAWWLWPLVLFLVTLALGVLSVVGGLGGATVFVPLVSGFFPFHLDFVRGAGLMVALAGALSAGPELLRRDLADLRLALPVALVTSVSAIAGARLGLALPAAPLQVALGLLVVAIMLVVLLARSAAFPDVRAPDRLARALRIAGAYYEAALGRTVEWRVHRTPIGFAVFAAIGLMAGLFGIGAGWANVPVLNLVMGAPLKVAAGTSVFLLATTDTAAAWIYLHQGAVLPLLVVPSVVGMMLGARLGVRLLAAVPPGVVRVTVVAVLLFSGLRALGKGLGVWP
jgi:hypothetical protein